MLTLIKPILTLALTFFASMAMAVLGPKIEDSQRPHSICAIEFYPSLSDGFLNSLPNHRLIDEICSAVVIGKYHLLTAAHCADKFPERPHRILCRDQKQTRVIHSTLNQNVKLDRLRFEENEHRNDSAILEVNQALEIPPMPFAITRNETLELIKNSSRCGIFGHGGFRHKMRDQGISTNALIKPEQIIFDDGLIIIDGYGGANSGLVEPGDSGGSLACQNEEQEWVHFAQVSGRNFNGASFFAPTYLLKKDIEIQNLINSLANQNPFNNVRQRWIKEDLKKQMKACKKKHKAFVEKEYIREKISLKADIKKCKEHILKELKRKVDKGTPPRLRVRSFALVELDQSKDMIDLDFGRDPKRLYQGENPFSIADHEFANITIEKIEERKVYGQLRIFGHTNVFSCVKNIICSGGTFHNVQLDLDDLIFPKR